MAVHNHMINGSGFAVYMIHVIVQWTIRDTVTQPNVTRLNWRKNKLSLSVEIVYIQLGFLRYLNTINLMQTQWRHLNYIRYVGYNKKCPTNQKAKITSKLRHATGS